MLNRVFLINKYKTKIIKQYNLIIKYIDRNKFLLFIALILFYYMMKETILYFNSDLKLF
jgi:hypothetical protein